MLIKLQHHFIIRKNEIYNDTSSTADFSEHIDICIKIGPDCLLLYTVCLRNLLKAFSHHITDRALNNREEEKILIHVRQVFFQMFSSENSARTEGLLKRKTDWVSMNPYPDFLKSVGSKLTYSRFFFYKAILKL